METVYQQMNGQTKRVPFCNIPTMEYYSAIKRSKNLIYAIIWMNLENIMPREISQTQKDN